MRGVALRAVKAEGTGPWALPGLSGLWHQCKGFLWTFSLERREDTWPSDGCERLKRQKFIQRVRHKLDWNPEPEHGLLSLSLFAVPHCVSVGLLTVTQEVRENGEHSFFFFLFLDWIFFYN